MIRILNIFILVLCMAKKKPITFQFYLDTIGLLKYDHSHRDIAIPLQVFTEMLLNDALKHRRDEWDSLTDEEKKKYY